MVHPLGRLLDVKQAADLLGLKASTIRRWILVRKIDVVRPNSRAVRIPESAITKIVQHGYRPAIEKR